MNQITITLDEKEIKTAEGESILIAAQKNGVYIPRLCHHPDLRMISETVPNEKIFQGTNVFMHVPDQLKELACELCLVQVHGSQDIVKACETKVLDGMQISTDTDALKKQRRQNLKVIMTAHPHACLTCTQSLGCTQEPCSIGVEVSERCCSRFGNCELRKVADYVGISDETPRWMPTEIPVLDAEPLIVRDYNLCIGCLRCVRGCQDVSDAYALGYIVDAQGKVKVGSVSSSLKESGCTFCRVCVEVCPAGALMDKRSGPGADKALPSKARTLRGKVSPVMLPPDEWLIFSASAVDTAPMSAGAFILADKDKTVFSIKGVDNLRQALAKELESGSRAKYFQFEEDAMYTKKETEYLQKYSLGAGGDDLDDLF